MTKKENKNNLYYFLHIAVLLYILFFSLICWRRYFSFSYGDWDLAIYSNFLYNALRGNFFSSLLGANFFGNHLNITLLLTLPIYAIFSHPYTLLFLQTLFLGLGAYPLFFIIKKESNENLAFLFVILYLIYPGVNFTNLNEFHPESFFPFLFFCTFYFLLLERTALVITFAFLCLMLKENFSLIIAMLGLFSLFDNKKKLGSVLLLSSLAWFYFSFFIIIPKLNRGIIGYYNIYPHFGNSPFLIIKNVLMHPIYALKIMFVKEKIIYLVKIFAPLIFLPLLNLKIFLISIPLFLQHLLSSRPMDYNINLYYTSELLPPIFISAFYGLNNLCHYLGTQPKKIFIFSVIFFGIISSLKIGPLPYLISNYQDFNTDELDKEKTRLLELIPGQSPVIATFEFLPYLSNRKELFSFHYVYTGFSILSKIKYELPPNVEYGIVDMDDGLTFRGFYRINNYKNLQKFFIQNNWQVLDYLDTVLVFKKVSGVKFDLCQSILILPKDMNNRIGIKIEDSIELAGLDLNTLYSNNSVFLNINFYWKCIKRTEKDIGAFLDVVDSHNKLINRHFYLICYRVFPTNSWQAGQIFKDKYRIKIPSNFSNNNYQLKIGFFEYPRGRLCKIDLPKDNLGRVSLGIIR